MDGEGNEFGFGANCILSAGGKSGHGERGKIAIRGLWVASVEYNKVTLERRVIYGSGKN